MRRIIGLIAAIALSCHLSVAHGQLGLLDRLKILSDAANALGAAGDAIGKIAEGITVAAQRGTEGVDAIVNRLDRKDMRTLLARTSALAATQNVRVVDALQGYIDAKRAGQPADWAKTQQDLTEVLQTVNALLPDVKAIRSDFVNEPAFETLLATLSGRQSVLMQLSTLPEPQTEDELASLDKAAMKYRELQSQLQKLNRAIADYNRAAAAPAPTVPPQAK